MGSRPPSALGAGIASAAWFTSTTRSRHDIRVSEPNGSSAASSATSPGKCSQPSNSSTRTSPRLLDIYRIINPYSESQFKTLKHHPTFPDRFGSVQDARTFCQRFFDWYNHAHYHSGIALLTPADVHYGRAEQIITARAAVLQGAFAAHPERFVRKPPIPPRLPEAVWINKPLVPCQKFFLDATPSDLR